MVLVFLLFFCGSLGSSGLVFHLFFFFQVVATAIARPVLLTLFRPHEIGTALKLGTHVVSPFPPFHPFVLFTSPRFSALGVGVLCVYTTFCLSVQAIFKLDLSLTFGIHFL